MDDRMAFETEMRDRFNRMERELRRWRRGALLVLALAGVGIAGAMANPAEKGELRIRTLRIVDDAGKDRIVLTAEPKVPDMTFLDPSGQSRLTLDIAEDHKPVLLFSDAGSKSSCLSLAIDNGSPLLELVDPATRKRVSFSVPKGGPMIRVFGEDGKLRTVYP